MNPDGVWEIRYRFMQWQLQDTQQQLAIEEQKNDNLQQQNRQMEEENKILK